MAGDAARRRELLLRGEMTEVGESCMVLYASAGFQQTARPKVVTVATIFRWVSVGTPRAPPPWMSVARPIVKGTRFMLTRRVRGRRFLLRPSTHTNQLIGYVVAVMQAKWGVHVHCLIVMSNHWHLVLSDVLTRSALTHAHAISIGPAIRVNAVAPGKIATSAYQPRSERSAPELRDLDHQQHPAGRVGTPDDAAALVAYLAYLASADASFITKQSFVIDGGMTRKMINAD